MNSKSKPSSNPLANSKPMMRRRRPKRPPAGHPTDAELIAAYTGTITKCPDGRAMGSMKSTDFGLAI